MPDAQRLDKWLWFARVVKTRSMAAALVLDGKVRVNRQRAGKPSQSVRPGDVLTVTAHSRVRVLKIVAPGDHRGPAILALTLYEDLTPRQVTEEFAGAPSSTASSAQAPHPARGGKPNKRDRRAIERMKREDPAGSEDDDPT